MKASKSITFARELGRAGFIVLSLAWGGAITAVGGVVYLILRALGHPPKRHGNAIFFEIGEGWGGVDLGPVFVVNRFPTEHTLDHELGHGYQNCLLGPFFIFICLASLIRYHYRRYLRRRAPERSLPPYDSVWFEGWATALGEAAMGRCRA